MLSDQASLLTRTPISPCVLPVHWSSSRTRPEWRQQWRVERGSSSPTGCKRTADRCWPTAGWGSTPHSPPPRWQSQSWNKVLLFHLLPSIRTLTDSSVMISNSESDRWVFSATYLPTSSSSLSEALGRCFFQMSMVKSVELLLKMEVSDDMSAAIITAIMSPRRPAIQRWMSGCRYRAVLEVKCTYWQGSFNLTAWHQFNHQFRKSNVGASDFGATHSHALLRINASHRVWNMRQPQVTHTEAVETKQRVLLMQNSCYSSSCCSGGEEVTKLLLLLFTPRAI